MADFGKSVKRDAHGRLLPGTRSISTGRPAVAYDFRERCRQFMEMKDGGWDKLVALADGSTTDQRFAIEMAANYAYGKPPQRVEQTGAGGGPILTATADAVLSDFTVAELRKLLEIAERQQTMKSVAHAAKS